MSLIIILFYLFIVVLMIISCRNCCIFMQFIIPFIILLEMFILQNLRMQASNYRVHLWTLVTRKINWCNPSRSGSKWKILPFLLPVLHPGLSNELSGILFATVHWTVWKIESWPVFKISSRNDPSNESRSNVRGPCIFIAETINKYSTS